MNAVSNHILDIVVCFQHPTASLHLYRIFNNDILFLSKIEVGTIGYGKT